VSLLFATTFREASPSSTVIAAPAWLALYHPVIVPWQSSDFTGSFSPLESRFIRALSLTRYESTP
jgi:hypothetical protein